MSQPISQKIEEAASRNAVLLSTLSETDYAPASLQQQNRLLEELESLLKTSTETKRKLERARDKEFKEHESYRDSTARRFFHKVVGKGAAFADKAAKEEREYFQALQDLHREENTHTSIQSQIAEASEVKTQYQADLERRQAAQAELDTLYSDIFGGPTQDFPEEDSLERASEAALQSYHDQRTLLDTEQHVARLIRSANESLQKALKEMESALSFSQADIIGFDSGTVMKRNCLHKAEMACTEAKMSIMQAQVMNPQVRSLPDVRIDQGGIVMDVVFDNFFSDMQFHESIKKSKQTIVQCKEALTQTAAECRSRQEVLIEELMIRQAVLDGTRAALQNKRAEIFARVAGPAEVAGSEKKQATKA